MHWNFDKRQELLQTLTEIKVAIQYEVKQLEQNFVTKYFKMV